MKQASFTVVALLLALISLGAGRAAGDLPRRRGHGCRYARVVDRTGRLRPDLQKTDFQVLDDGRPAEVQQFSSDPQPLTRRCWMLDMSGSMVARVVRVRDAACAFVDATARRPCAHRDVRDRDRHQSAANRSARRAAPNPPGRALARWRTPLWNALHEAMTVQDAETAAASCWRSPMAKTRRVCPAARALPRVSSRKRFETTSCSTRSEWKARRSRDASCPAGRSKRRRPLRPEARRRAGRDLLARRRGAARAVSPRLQRPGSTTNCTESSYVSCAPASRHAHGERTRQSRDDAVDSCGDRCRPRRRGVRICVARAARASGRVQALVLGADGRRSADSHGDSDHRRRSARRRESLESGPSPAAIVVFFDVSASVDNSYGKGNAAEAPRGRSMPCWRRARRQSIAGASAASRNSFAWVRECRRTLPHCARQLTSFWRFPTPNDSARRRRGTRRTPLSPRSMVNVDDEAWCS